MASGNDIETARETYNGFTHLVKWGAIGVVIVTVIVIALITS